MTVLPARTSTGHRVRWRFVATVLTSATLALGLMDQLGWKLPKQALAEVEAQHVVLHQEIVAGDRASAVRLDRSDSVQRYELVLLESVAKDLCLRRTPTQRVRLGLPCRQLLRDAMSDVPTLGPGQDP